MSCTLQTGFFPSSDGKSQSFYQIWVPEQAPRAIVLLSHGMCEYVGRYADFAEYLGSRGFVLCGADHIGHGKTARNTAELGYIPKNGGRGFLREDLHSMEKLARKTFPGLPVFLFGHSMGSFIARYYEEKYAEGL
ncbi:MAG: alpha/beta fold hydrolase, partial [Eubacteriales bacterium]